MRKRVLSIALALLMVLMLLPFGALASNQSAAAPYKKMLSWVQTSSCDTANGLFTDVDGDGVPELLIAYEFHDDHTRNTVFCTVKDGGSAGLVNADFLEGDKTFSSEDYSSISVVSHNGARQIMAMRMDYYPFMEDEQLGQLYWDIGEFWLYNYADGKATLSDHWSYSFLELEDGRYIVDESTVLHNKKNSNPEALGKVMESIGVLQTVSLFTDTNGYPIDQLLAVTEGKFIDVPAKAYYADPVAWAVEKGVTNGTSPMTFSPENPCTRGQVVTFLWRAAGEPSPGSKTNPFKDVSKDAYYYKAVLWAVEQGITNGTSATTFSPNNPCTRGQVVTFLYRNANTPKVTAKNPFKDVKSGAYYYDAVLWAVKNEITNGTSKTAFSPDQTCTRGQIVTFLYRALSDPNWEPAQPVRTKLTMAALTNEANPNMTEKYGKKIAQYITDNSDTGVTVTSTGDSRSNLKALLDGDVQLCVCRADEACAAYNGTGYYAETGANQDFAVVAVLYKSGFYIATRDDSLQSVKDLRGKTVSVGPEGSAQYIFAMDILGVYGLTEQDVNPVYLSLEETAAALNNREIDAAFVQDGNAWAEALRKYYLSGMLESVETDRTHVKKLIAEKPYYMTSRDEPGSVYIATLLLARNDVSEQDVHNCVSTITDAHVMPWIDYSELMSKGFASGAKGIPYHPGAAAYFGI